MSKHDHQLELETLFSKNQLMDRITAEFVAEPDFLVQFEKFNIPEKFGFGLLAQMALHKRADLPTLLGCLRHHCDTAQEVADLMLQAAVADLVDWSPTTGFAGMFIVKFTISADVQLELDRFQYPLPMVIEPKELKKNSDSGYLITTGSVILRNNHHNDDVCLDHINRINKMKFQINFDTSKMVKNEWRNLDRPKDGESTDDYERRVRAFNKYDATARDVIDLLVAEGNEFNLTHKVDKRGRTYCQGHHVTYQGTPWNKACVEFYNQEVCLG